MTVSAFQQTSGEPQRRPAPPGPSEPPAREPVFNAPLPALVLVVLIVGGYGLQSRFAPDGLIQGLAFTPAGLAAGRWGTLLTALFLHGGWSHALINAAMALAFGAPVARFFGRGAVGAIVFFVFYLLCGALGNLGFAAFHLGSPSAVVGASGAVCGLSAAAARLLAGQGRLGSMRSPPAIALGLALVVGSALIVLFGPALVPGAGGAGIAWEAHLAGFLAGLVLIGPFARIAQRR